MSGATAEGLFALRSKTMVNMLESGYLSVLEAKDRDEFLRELLRFTTRLGFETVSATVVIDRPVGKPEFITVDNTPAGYLAMFHDYSLGQRDPVTQHCKMNSVPIIWDRTTYASANMMEKWEEQARFGYCYGMSVAMHLPQGRHFMIGMDRDQPISEDVGEVTRLVSALQLFAVYAQEAASRMLKPTSVQPSLPTLTQRELEVLRWTMEGKTAWELGRILGIAENTAVRHVYNATRKLGGVNKHQAVLRAMRLGLIR